MSGWAKVEFEDKGLQELFKRLAALRDFRIRVGYQDAEGRMLHPEAEISVAKLAAVHEFGSPEQGIPERSFIRSTITWHEVTIRQFEESQIALVAEGKIEPVEAMSAIGAFVCQAIRGRLENASAWAVPTKNGEPPLTDTGTLARNLSWQVRRGSEVVAKGS